MIEKADDVLAANGVVADIEVQLAPDIIQGAHDVGPLLPAPIVAL